MGPQYSTQNSRILTIRTPKLGTPYFRDLPYTWAEPIPRASFASTEALYVYVYVYVYIFILVFICIDVCLYMSVHILRGHHEWNPTPHHFATTDGFLDKIRAPYRIRLNHESQRFVLRRVPCRVSGSGSS